MSPQNQQLRDLARPLPLLTAPSEWKGRQQHTQRCHRQHGTRAAQAGLHGTPHALLATGIEENTRRFAVHFTQPLPDSTCSTISGGNNNTTTGAS